MPFNILVPDLCMSSIDENLFSLIEICGIKSSGREPNRVSMVNVSIKQCFFSKKKKRKKPVMIAKQSVGGSAILLITIKNIYFSFVKGEYFDWVNLFLSNSFNY